jgi:hypothetical protein
VSRGEEAPQGLVGADIKVRRLGFAHPDFAQHEKSHPAAGLT